MDLEVTIQAFWLVSALKDTKVYDCLKSAGRSSQAALIETRSTASGSNRESLDWLSLSPKVPIASRVGFVSFFASLPTAQSLGCPYPCCFRRDWPQMPRRETAADVPTKHRLLSNTCALLSWLVVATPMAAGSGMLSWRARAIVLRAAFV